MGVVERHCSDWLPQFPHYHRLDAPPVFIKCRTLAGDGSGNLDFVQVISTKFYTTSLAKLSRHRHLEKDSAFPKCDKLAPQKYCCRLTCRDLFLPRDSMPGDRNRLPGIPKRQSSMGIHVMQKARRPQPKASETRRM